MAWGPAGGRGKAELQAANLEATENRGAMIAALIIIWALSVNLYNNGLEKCPNLNSLGRLTSPIIVIWRDHKDVQLPRTQNDSVHRR